MKFLRLIVIGSISTALFAFQTADDAKKAADSTKKAAKKTKADASDAADSAQKATSSATDSAKKTASKAAPNNVSAAEIEQAKASGKVWVNTESGVYHKSGQWYGTTKQGKFMTEQEAIKAGYHAAKSQ